MARFKIYSKDGQSVRYEGKPRYNGAYLKPSYLEFSEIESYSPIAWEVGDYVDYPRTGMRYYLYFLPQPSKNARKNSHGGAFTYSGVQFHAATKELEIALFKDLVTADNNIHFSTNPDVATFENVEGVARRIQACMDYFYPGRWEIRMAEFDAVADAEIIEKISVAKNFVLSGGTCLDALSRIYELWQDIGWVHTNENGKDVIVIGYPNKRIAENTTDAFVYGEGSGLTAIKKNQTNKEEFATRLYVYGSDRNLPARYYNNKDIFNAESADIRNLMIPLDKWGLTDGKPDARKAYLENAEAVAKYGLIPKTHYFDSEDAGADIHPTISGMTIGMIREALNALGQTDSAYYPSKELYPDEEQRVDKVRWCDNPDDKGDVGDVLQDGNSSSFDGEIKSIDVSSGTITKKIINNEIIASAEFSYSEAKTCKVKFSSDVTGYVSDDGYEKVEVRVRVADSNSRYESDSKEVVYPAVLNEGKWEYFLPSVEYDYRQTPKATFGANVFLTVTVTLPSGSEDKTIFSELSSGIHHVDLYLIMAKTFLLRLHEIGFNIDKQASLGKGKVISMKTGACAGRNFVIESCRHKGGLYVQGYWDLTLRRQKDNTLQLMFPNTDAKITAGDEFVLTDTAMPELYVQVEMARLLAEGEKLLARASKIQNCYEPSIDAKVMLEQGRTLREGMFMEVTDADVVDNITDYILIDTLAIYEDESAIPTYKVTLRERRKVTYKGTPSATSEPSTESVEDDVQTEANVDLSDYAKKEEVEEVSDLLASMWHLDENGNLVTELPVHIKNNLFLDGDEGSMGGGEDNSVGLNISELQAYLDENKYVRAEDIEGLVDLSGYYTSKQVDSLTNGLSSRIYSIEQLIGTDNGTITGAIDKFYEITAFLDGMEDTTLKSLTDQFALESEVVKINGNQTINGAKTFSALATFLKGVTIEGNVRIKGNLFVDGDEASTGGGDGETGGGTGLNLTQLETYLEDNSYLYGSVNGDRSADFFAPVSAGSEGSLLVARGGSNAPVWKSIDELGLGFDGGEISNDIWFASGAGIKTEAGYNMLQSIGDDIIIGSFNGSTVDIRASSLVEVILDAETAFYINANYLYSYSKLFVSPDGWTPADAPSYIGNRASVIDGNLWVMGTAGAQIGFGTKNDAARLVITGTGGMLNFSFVESEDSSSGLLTLSQATSYIYSMLRVTNPRNASRALQIYTNEVNHYIGVDASDNLIYNDNIVLHSGNYTDFISGEGGSVSGDYLPLTGGTITGPLWIKSNKNPQLAIFHSDSNAWAIHSDSSVLSIGTYTTSGGYEDYLMMSASKIGLYLPLTIYLSSSSKSTMLTFSDGTNSRALGLTTANQLAFNGATVLTSSNYSDYISVNVGEIDAMALELGGFIGREYYWYTDRLELEENGVPNGSTIIINSNDAQLNFVDIIPAPLMRGTASSMVSCEVTVQKIANSTLMIPAYSTSRIRMVNPSTGLAPSSSTIVANLFGVRLIWCSQGDGYWIGHIIY